MFGKDAGASGEAKLNSIIGKGSNCTGDVVVAGGLKIDGNFKGTIKADSVFVGKDAVIEATIDVNVAVIGGKVVGDVVARESLELQTKAELIGNVKTKTLVVAETAVLDGYCDMGRKDRHAKQDEAKTPPGAKPTAPSPAGTPATPAGQQAPAGPPQPAPGQNPQFKFGNPPKV